MKKIKILIICLIGLLNTFYNLNAQSNAGITTVGSATACPGTIISIPINLSGLTTKIEGFSLTIFYDATVLSALQTGNTSTFVINPNSSTLPLTNWLYAQTLKSTGINQVKMGWVNSTPVLLAKDTFGISHICDIQFRYSGGTTTLTFDNSSSSGIDCEYTDNLGYAMIDVPTASYYINGNVSQNSSSTAPASVTLNPSTAVCPGTSVTLTETGGTLGTGAIWKWYSVSCGGTLSGNGVAFTIVPTASTTYYVRAEGACNTTSCISAIVTTTSLVLPSSVTATPATICSGSGSSLSAISTGNSINWWSASTGGSSFGTSASGVSLAVSPTITTTYYTESFTSAVGSLTFNYTGAIQQFTVPAGVNSLAIDARGASGGYTSTGTGGRGARMTGTFTVTQGSVLTVLVGQCPGSTSLFPGGGGGTFVALGSSDSSATPLIVAGGGGGGYTLGYSGIDAPTTQAGTYTTNNYLGANGYGANSAPCTGGGGGFYSSGAADSYSFQGGRGFRQGGAGACAPPNYASTYQCGGFGGGSTGDYYGSCNTYSGNGGGYSGGSGNSTSIKYVGEAGGSYNGGTNQQNYPGNNTGNGQVIFTWNAVLCTSSGRKSVTVSVSTPSTAPGSASSSPSLICSGSTTSLTVTGGSLGVGEVWKWYSASCGGITRGAGVTLAITPTVTTTYYVRAQGLCNTTTCVSTIVTVNSAAATSASASPTIITGGSPATLTESGGTLGLNSNWYWYSGSCGGTPSGTGASIIVSPAVSTLFYVRVQGACNTTTCVSTTVTVCTSSTAASSASSSSPLICSGSSTTLSFTGGILGVGGIWRWYSASCGGISKGTGLTLTAAPTVTTTYYVRAQGLCNTTTCVSTIVIVNSTAATSATASPTSIVPGSSSTLTLTGGVLGLNSNWYWYSGSCGGTYAGTGVTIVQSPTTNITYFVRAEGACNPTTCVNVSVTVCSNSTPASSASGSPSVICTGSSTTLSLSGGSLGNIEIWKWYSASCGGISRGTGVTLILSPTVTTIYYVRAQGTCNTTTCVSTTVIVNSSPAASATASPSVINPGASTTLTENSGILNPGSTWRWYSSSCGGTFIKTGVSIVQSPTVTCLYYVRSENSSCSPSTCISVTVTVNSTKSYQYNNISEKNENSLTNELIIYPNPSKDIVNIKYNIAKSGFVNISLYNVLGEKIIDVINKAVLKGVYDFEFNLATIQSGIYTCKMVLSDKSCIVKRMVVSK